MRRSCGAVGVGVFEFFIFSYFQVTYLSVFFIHCLIAVAGHNSNLHQHYDLHSTRTQVTRSKMEKKYIPDPNIPILVKIEPETDATGGPGKVGEKFVHYWKKKLGENCTADDIASKIPNVDIKFKVKRLSDFDSKAGTFYVDCLLMLDWEDESLADADESPDFMEHFWPKVEILNQTPGMFCLFFVFEVL